MATEAQEDSFQSIKLDLQSPQGCYIPCKVSMWTPSALLFTVMFIIQQLMTPQSRHGARLWVIKVNKLSSRREGQLLTNPVRGGKCQKSSTHQGAMSNKAEMTSVLGRRKGAGPQEA